MNEMWRIHFHLKGHEQRDDDDIDFEVDRVHITYQNQNYLKEQFCYGSRDYLYYKKRCGADVATVQAIDYSRHAAQMLKDNANEREIRFIMSTDQRVFLTMFIVSLLIYSSEITLLYYT
jgi:hypothetical protein